jgi:hypothetical protein
LEGSPSKTALVSQDSRMRLLKRPRGHLSHAIG